MLLEFSARLAAPDSRGLKRSSAGSIRLGQQQRVIYYRSIEIATQKVPVLLSPLECRLALKKSGAIYATRNQWKSCIA